MRDYWFYVQFKDITKEVYTSCRNYARILARSERIKAGQDITVISTEGPYKKRRY